MGIPGHKQEAGSAVEQLGLEPAPMLDVVLEGEGLASESQSCPFPLFFLRGLSGPLPKARSFVYSYFIIIIFTVKS